MRGSDWWRIAFCRAVTSGKIGWMSNARSSSTQFPEIMMAPVGSPGPLGRAGRREDDGVRPAATDLLDQPLGAGLAPLVTGAGGHGAVHVALPQGPERVAVGRNVGGEPAPSPEQVVLPDVAARLLEDLQQPQRRLPAEGP